MWAVEADRWLRGKRCLDDVLPILDDKAKNVRQKVLVVITIVPDSGRQPLVAVAVIPRFGSSQPGHDEYSTAEADHGRHTGSSEYTADSSAAC
jgi:hypothetical protein